MPAEKPQARSSRGGEDLKIASEKQENKFDPQPSQER